MDRKKTMLKRKLTLTEEDELLEKSVLGRDEILIEQLEKTDRKKRKYKTKQRKPVWTDQDENHSLQELQSPKWADLNKKNEQDEEELSEMTHASDFLKHGDTDDLRKGVLVFKRCTDVNRENQKEGRLLRTVEFHPTASVAVVSGMSGIASLYQVDGKSNPKIQSVVFKKFPVYTSHFSADGQELIVGSNVAGYFYYYDMINGKIVRIPWNKDMNQKNMQQFEVSPNGKLLAFHGRYGSIHLITAKTKEWVTTLKMNGQVRSLAFNKEGDRLYSHGDLGEVYIWDMNTRDCIHKFHDDGCVKGTAINLSPNGQYLACGSDSGVVNIYDTSSLLLSSVPKPTKILLNLTTSISKIKFNHSSELMVIASDQKDNAIKLVHCTSMEVFKNFPKSNYNMKLPMCFDISLNSGYLAVSNNVGRALLYRLKHYDNY